MPLDRRFIRFIVFAMFSLASCQNSNRMIAFDDFLNDFAVQRLEADAIKITPEGDELAILLQQHIVEKRSVDIEKFDVNAKEIFKEKSATVESLMNSKVSLLNGYGVQNL